VARGQEFVLDCDDYPEAGWRWLMKLFEMGLIYLLHSRMVVVNF